MDSLCIATNNNHKIEEIRSIIDFKLRLVSLKDIGCFEELPETSSTIEGNSLQKAEYVFRNYHVPCFADDTGLEVEALDNAPGVDSAHYAGPERDSKKNIDLLLKNLAGKKNRSARFRTVISLVGVKTKPLTFEGIVSGQIADELKGANGFGYDPVFIPDGHEQTFAEMGLAEKNTVSHRFRAVAQLLKYLKENHQAAKK